jgi:hypothetical protein
MLLMHETARNDAESGYKAVDVMSEGTYSARRSSSFPLCSGVQRSSLRRILICLVASSNYEDASSSMLFLLLPKKGMTGMELSTRTIKISSRPEEITNRN